MDVADDGTPASTPMEVDGHQQHEDETLDTEPKAEQDNATTSAAAVPVSVDDTDTDGRNEDRETKDGSSCVTKPKDSDKTPAGVTDASVNIAEIAQQVTASSSNACAASAETGCNDPVAGVAAEGDTERIDGADVVGLSVEDEKLGDGDVAAASDEDVGDAAAASREEASEVPDAQLALKSGANAGVTADVECPHKGTGARGDGGEQDPDALPADESTGVAAVTETRHEAEHDEDRLSEGAGGEGEEMTRREEESEEMATDEDGAEKRGGGSEHLLTSANDTESGTLNVVESQCISEASTETVKSCVKDILSHPSKLLTEVSKPEEVKTLNSLTPDCHQDKEDADSISMDAMSAASLAAQSSTDNLPTTFANTPDTSHDMLATEMLTENESVLTPESRSQLIAKDNGGRIEDATMRAVETLTGDTEMDSITVTPEESASRSQTTPDVVMPVTDGAVLEGDVSTSVADTDSAALEGDVLTSKTDTVSAALEGGVLTSITDTDSAALDGDVLTPAVDTDSTALEGDALTLAVDTDSTALEDVLTHAVDTDTTILEDDVLTHAVDTDSTTLEGDVLTPAVDTDSTALEDDVLTPAVDTDSAALQGDALTSASDSAVLQADEALMPVAKATALEGDLPSVEAAAAAEPMTIDGDVMEETEDVTMMSEEADDDPAKNDLKDGDDASEELLDQSLPASRLFEYQWPHEKGAEWYMLQEQVCDFLAVVSFKRKYPDLQRRPLELKEKIYLLENSIVSEVQSNLGLTALKMDQVHELMSKDYPEKFKEYSAVLQKRDRQKISDCHRGYEMLQIDKNKLALIVKKAVKSAAEFNAIFMKERREERRAYIDLQTNEIHYPRRPKVAGPHKPAGAYPVALIPGQFQDHYKSYTPQELKYLPLNTAVYNVPRPLKTVFADPNQPSEEDTEEEKDEERTRENEDGKTAAERGSDGSSSGSDSTSGSTSGSENESEAEKSADSVVMETPVKAAGRPVVKRLRNSVRKSPWVVLTEPGSELGVKKELCNICKSTADSNRIGEAEDLVTCSECHRSAHPSCLELTTEMIPIIRTYQWQCMECKACVKCNEAHDEEKMMFCDHCDRGYHSYCMGLQSIPTGRWECSSCRQEDTPRAKRSRKR